MTLAEAAAQLRLLLDQVRFLASEVDDHLRAGDLAHRVQVLATVRPQVAGELQLGPALRQCGADDDHLLAEVGQLLLAQGDAVGADQVVLVAIRLDPGLGFLHLLAQLLDPVAQPHGGPAGRIRLRVDLVLHVEVGQDVGHLGGLVRIDRGEGDAHDVGAALLRHLQPRVEAVDDVLALA